MWAEFKQLRGLDRVTLRLSLPEAHQHLHLVCSVGDCLATQAITALLILLESVPLLDVVANDYDSVIRRQRQEDCSKFKANLVYIATPGQPGLHSNILCQKQIHKAKGVTQVAVLMSPQTTKTGSVSSGL